MNIRYQLLLGVLLSVLLVTVAPGWLITVDLAEKEVTVDSDIALRESVPTIVTNISPSVSSNLVLTLTDRRGTLCASTSSLTNGTGDSASGTLSLNTTALTNVFANKSLQTELDFTLGVWDTSLNKLLVNDVIAIKNNPYVAGMPSPTAVTHTLASNIDMDGYSMTNGVFVGDGSGLTNISSAVVILGGSGITVTTDGTTNTIALYAEPTIDSFTADVTTFEVGATASQSILSWSLSGGAITNQSINQSTPALDLAWRSVTNVVPFTTNRTYTLTISDADTTNTSTRTVYFRYKRFWGYDAATSLSTSEEIIALGNSEYATSGVKSTTSVSPGGEYLYYCYPSAWAEIDPYMNGFPVTSFVVSTNSFTNAQSFVTTYRIYRSPNVLVGDWDFEAQ